MDRMIDGQTRLKTTFALLFSNAIVNKENLLFYLHLFSNKYLQMYIVKKTLTSLVVGFFEQILDHSISVNLGLSEKPAFSQH